MATAKNSKKTVTKKEPKLRLSKEDFILGKYTLPLRDISADLQVKITRLVIEKVIHLFSTKQSTLSDSDGALKKLKYRRGLKIHKGVLLTDQVIKLYFAKNSCMPEENVGRTKDTLIFLRSDGQLLLLERLWGRDYSVKWSYVRILSDDDLRSGFMREWGISGFLKALLRVHEERLLELSRSKDKLDHSNNALAKILGRLRC